MPAAGQARWMAMLLRLLLTKLLPARTMWVLAAFVLGRAVAARRERRPAPAADAA